MGPSRMIRRLLSLRTPAHAVTIAVLLALAATPAWALKSDRDQPMNVESDALQYESQQQRSVFTGNVVVTKGSITMHGSKLVVTQTAGGKDDAVMYGAPGKRAFYREKRDGGGEQYVEGEGDRIDYDGQADIVKFVGHAEARRLENGKLQDQINGDVITLNNVTEVYNVDLAQKGKSGQDRVRATFAPRQPVQPKGAPAKSADTPLQPTPRLHGNGARH